MKMKMIEDGEDDDSLAILPGMLLKAQAVQTIIVQRESRYDTLEHRRESYDPSNALLRPRLTQSPTCSNLAPSSESVDYLSRKCVPIRRGKRISPTTRTRTTLSAAHFQARKVRANPSKLTHDRLQI